MKETPSETAVRNHALSQAVTVLTSTPPWRRLMAFVQAEASADEPNLTDLRTQIMREIGEKLDQGIAAAKRQR